jgi:hypothetical protein
MRLPALAALFVPLALAGCPDKPDARSPDAPGGDAERTIRCQRDSDCSSPACGPCTSGAPLLQGGPSCAVNPCPDVPVVCSPQKICVVK